MGYYLLKNASIGTCNIPKCRANDAKCKYKTHGYTSLLSKMQIARKRPNFVDFTGIGGTSTLIANSNWQLYPHIWYQIVGHNMANERQASVIPLVPLFGHQGRASSYYLYDGRSVADSKRHFGHRHGSWISHYSWIGLAWPLLKNILDLDYLYK